MSDESSHRDETARETRRRLARARAIEEAKALPLAEDATTVCDECAELYVWLTRYSHGTVGQIAVYSESMQGHMVLSTRSRRIADTTMRALAELHSQSTGQAVWLRTYKNYEDGPVYGRL